MNITTTLFNLLLAYYQCDYIANNQPLGYNAAQKCFAVYSAVKQEISGLDPIDPKTSVESYLSWKQWEKDNHLLVDNLKAQARKIVDS
jgi:hypothetical protein